MKYLSFPTAVVIATAVLIFCVVAYPAMAQGLGRGGLDQPVMDWPVANPDTMGLDMEALKEHQELCRRSEASGCLVAYKGFIVQEWYNPNFPSDPPHMQPWIGTRSAVKSWVGLLVGMLLADGKIKSINDPVSNYIPEWKAGAEAGVTIRHLLTMTSGVAKHAGEGPHPGVVAARNTTGYVLNLPLARAPGERWSYGNEGAQLLSPILERAAGMPLAAYARERLFDPLGMRTTWLHVDEYYNTVTIGGARTRLREFARIGQLMLNEGNWNGQQIVPAEWVRESTQPIPENEYYGYLWWVHADANAYSAAGSLGQVIYVFPELELVAARLQRDVEPGVTVRYWNGETRVLLRRIVGSEPTGE